MSIESETFATHVGCMDGRVQGPTSEFAKRKFGATYIDTITEAGIVGRIAHNPSSEFLDGLKNKLEVSLNKHHSRGVVVEGHEECVGNPVDEKTHKEDVRKSIEVLRSMTKTSVPIFGVYVRRKDGNWVVEEVPETEMA